MKQEKIKILKQLLRQYKGQKKDLLKQNDNPEYIMNYEMQIMERIKNKINSALKTYFPKINLKIQRPYYQDGASIFVANETFIMRDFQRMFIKPQLINDKRRLKELIDRLSNYISLQVYIVQKGFINDNVQDKGSGLVIRYNDYTKQRHGTLQYKIQIDSNNYKVKLKDIQRQFLTLTDVYINMILTTIKQIKKLQNK